MRRPEIERLLPGVYQIALHPLESSALEPDRALAATLDAMEELHQPCEDILDRLDAYIDPRRAPDRFVPFLAGWLDLDWLAVDGRVTTGLGRLRELVALAMALSKWRGTARGLLGFLQTATGLSGFEIESPSNTPPGDRRAFHVVVHAPNAASEHAALVERIVEMEKPAFVTYEVRYQ
jgi:phage tail-like protein